MSTKLKVLLFALFIFSFLIRSININSYPPALNWDEVSHGYNAYSILKTGKDEWGSRLPLIFRAYGDYKLPLYIYLTVVPVKLFGLTTFSTRFISILAGSILPIIVFLIFRKYSISVSRSLLFASLLSVQPWSIFLSRIALEANLFLLLFTISLYFALDKKLGKSMIFFSLCLLTYNSARVLLIFYLAYLLSQYKLILKKNNILPIVFFLSICVLSSYQYFFGQNSSRYKWVGLVDEGAINYLNEKRGQLSDHPFLAKILYNKPVYFVSQCLKNYTSHFSPSFLFIKGGSHYQFNIPYFPLIYPYLLPFFVVGVLLVVFRSKLYHLLLLLAISPIPSIITRDSPHTLRSIVFIEIASLISIQGLNFFLDKVNRKIILQTLIILVISIAGILVFFRKYQVYSNQYSSSWQYGYRQVYDYLSENQKLYDNIYITKKYGEPHEFMAFYQKIPPQDFQKRKQWDYHSLWYWVNSYDKITFVNDWEMVDTINKLGFSNILVITSPGNYPKGMSPKKTINFLDNQPAFDIVDYDQ